MFHTRKWRLFSLLPNVLNNFITTHVDIYSTDNKCLDLLLRIYQLYKEYNLVSLTIKLLQHTDDEMYHPLLDI